MLETLTAAVHFAWLWLATRNALAPYALVTFAVYGSIYVWRKVHPRSWLWIESRLPWAAELTKDDELAKNIALSLPSVLLGAVLSASVGGLDVATVVLGALAGALSPLVHHLRKSLPFDPYRGALGEVKLPKDPKVPTIVTTLALCLGLSGCGLLADSQAKSLLPCDAHDHAAQADLLANDRKCDREKAACGKDADCLSAVKAECNRYVDERCALPEGK